MSDKLSLTDIIFTKPDRISMPYSWIQHIPFAFCLVEKVRPDIVVELGVHTGNSFTAFCQAVKILNLKTRCFGIDTWAGDNQSGLYGQDIFSELEAYIQTQYADNAQLIKKEFDTALKQFDESSIDILHIDGCHSYDAVKNDFKAWLPKISDKGIILLHDTTVKKDGYGVWQLWEEISCSYETYNFKHGQGLGIIVVGKSVDNKLINLIRELKMASFYQKIFQKLGEHIFLEAIQEIETISKLYVNCGQGYTDSLPKRIDRFIYDGHVSISWELNTFPKIESLRWDPIEDRWCIVKIEDVIYKLRNENKTRKLNLNIITNNGRVDKDGGVIFETIDPIFFIPIHGEIERITINAQMVLTSPKYIYAKYNEKELITKLFINDGDGFKPEAAITHHVHMKKNGLFNIKFDLENSANIKSLRWDPIEDRHCNVKIDKIEYIDINNQTHDFDLTLISHNGNLGENGFIIFETTDPNIILPLNGIFKSICIEGCMQFIDNPAFPHE